MRDGFCAGDSERGEFAGLLISLDRSVPVLPERRAGLSNASHIKNSPSKGDSLSVMGREMLIEIALSVELLVEGTHVSWRKDPAGETSESVSSLSPSHEVLDL